MDRDLESVGEQIAEQAAHLDAAMHRLLTDLREFDQRGGWHAQGATSCAHWLSWRVGWTLVTAREHVRVANKLADLPAIDDALRRGAVSYAKVRAMTRVATPANESLLLAYAQLMTASQLELQCRKYALALRHGDQPHPLADQQRRYVRRRDTEDGMVKLEAVLHPDEAELVWAMLDHAASQRSRHLAAPPPLPAPSDSAESRLATTTDAIARPDAVLGAPFVPAVHACDDSAESRMATTSDAIARPDAVLGASFVPAAHGGDDSAESRVATAPEMLRAGVSELRRRDEAARRAFSRADALVSLAQGYLRGERFERAPIELTLTISESSLRAGAVDPIDVGEIGQSFVPPETARRLTCDAGVVEVLESAAGTPLSVGRKRRTVSGSLKRALYKRDQRCTFPGCDHRIFLEGHHIKHWADGGETSLSNTALMCSHHHRYVHEYGYSIELGADQRPRFRDPHGRLVRPVPERFTPADLGWPRIRALNEPLAITAETITSWDGTPVDYGTIVGHLLAADRLAS